MIALLKERAVREEIFPRISDAGWTMLLDLWTTNRALTVSDLCVGSFNPYTTALRHLDLLVRGGLVVRSPDTVDTRRVFVGLTDLGRERLDRFAEKTKREAA